jgi:protein SCO1/2
MLRTPQALIPYIVALGCVAAGGLGYETEQSSGPRVVTVGTPQIGGPFSLTNQNGQRKTDADFRGRWMLVYFGYTNCPDVCPTTLALMSAALKELGGRATLIAPIFITVDPGHDTPKMLKEYLASVDSRFIGLTGSQQQIAVVAREYKVYSVKRPLKGGGYAIDHSSVVCLMDPSGKFAAVYDNSQTPEQIAADLRKRL